MKIEKIKKKRNGLYEVSFANSTTLDLYDDVILKYELLLKKEIDAQTLPKIIAENSLLECYHKALKYLNSKLRTEKEIRTRLKDYSPEALNYTITRLKKEGFLDPKLYIRSYINDEVNFNYSGPHKILFDLKKLGFKEEDIIDYLNTIADEVWENKITKYVTKKINSNNKLSGMMLKYKITKDLQSKGFKDENIINVIDNYTFNDDPKIYQKEYQKIHNKLSKKYSGSILLYQVKNKMYEKGFRI